LADGDSGVDPSVAIVDGRGGKSSWSPAPAGASAPARAGFRRLIEIRRDCLDIAAAPEQNGAEPRSEAVSRAND